MIDTTSAIRYAIVGTGGRSVIYSHALASGRYPGHTLSAFCDSNPGRMEFYNRELHHTFSAPPVPCYRPEDFLRMLSEQRISRVIICTPDNTHHDYIVRALEAGCDAVVEKPITIDLEKCKKIHKAIAATGRKVIVTFNCRYMPKTSRIREVLASGAIGKILSVHFEWLLDVRHGADYFRRWHRDIEKSGGLMLHKSSHHFDLVNWWLDSRPTTVFGMGDLRFYGRANGRANDLYRDYDRATGNPQAANDPFALVMKPGDRNWDLYRSNEHHDGYLRDQNVFGDGISIHDDMSVLVRYANNATMTYHLTAYSPWEGWRLMVNGSKGRLEAVQEENAYLEQGNDPRLEQLGASIPVQEGAVKHLLIRPLWGKPYEVPVGDEAGSHGGGDHRMLDDLFLGAGEDPLHRRADHQDGIWSIMTGIAANRSFSTGLPVSVDALLADEQIDPREAAVACGAMKSRASRG